MYKLGSNQYHRQPKKLLQKSLYGLKVGTWLNIYIVVFITALLVSYCYVNRPVKLISPVAQAHAQEIVKPEIQAPENPGASNVPTIVTPYDYVMSLPHGDIVWRIYGNESSFGKNTFLYCKKQGLVNDVGYNVLGNPPTCFASFEDEMLKVSSWFDVTLKSHTLAESLCIYNLGKDLPTCRYAEDFLHL